MLDFLDAILSEGSTFRKPGIQKVELFGAFRETQQYLTWVHEEPMMEKILLVDDDAETVRLITAVLNRQGFEVIAAYEGPTCIHVAQTEQPDLILLDIMMPGMDGYQVTRILRENPETTNIPIIMFSAKNQVDDRVRGYEAGIDDYLTKPIHPAEMVARVKSLITRSKMLGSTFGEKGHTIGILAAKGGIGASTFTLNLAITCHQQLDKEVIAAEMRPGHGSWQVVLKLNEANGINRLLRLSASAITTATVKDQLHAYAPGIHLLIARNRTEDVKLLIETEQLNKVTKLLPLLAPLIFLDFGAGDLLNLEELVTNCDEIFLLIHPYPSALLKARRYLDDLTEWGFIKTKPITLVMMHHALERVQTSRTDIEEFLLKRIAFQIPNVPEIALLAETQGKSQISIQPESNLVKSYLEIAQHIHHPASNNKPEN
jgi:CheY-like chemotaxis protein/MinD-like ATPase involved in chromosome partitioning or flagellar assembly